MTSDISRQTFDFTKHYSQVVMQQGRVQLDADWNEQQEMLQYRLETQTRDMVGQSGVPSADGGFKVSFTSGGGDLLISPGRMYVDGILCEVDKATPVKVLGLHGDNGVAVKNFIVDGRAWEKGQWVELLNEHRRPVRHFQISAVTQEKETGLLILTFHTDQENPGIKVDQRDSIEEVRRVITYTTQPNYPDPQFTTKSSSGLPRLNLPSGQPLLLAYLDVWQRYITALEDERIREVALDGPDTSARIQTTWQVKILPCPLSSELERLLKKDTELGTELRALEAIGPTGPESKTAQRIKEIRAEQEQLAYEITRYLSTYRPDAWEDLQEIPTGQLNVTTYNADKTQSSGYSGLQNQLYRVEIHKVPADGSPVIFKWSHDNASIASLVEVRGDTVIVPGTGQGGILAYSRGQFVEVVSDRSELNGEPGKLLQITRVDTLTNRLTLESSAGSDGTQIKIRLWDGKGEVGEQPTWIPLDGGIKIHFSDGTYKRGDFWLIPARTSTKEVEWPPYQVPNTHPLPQSRRGIQHHYSRLAFIRLYQGQKENRTVYDCRRRFIPLPDVINAMHVVGINWDNDSIHSRKSLKWKEQKPQEEQEEGLQIELDYTPEPHSIKAETMIVTLETNLPGGGEGSFIMHGNIQVMNNVITWHWKKREKEGWLAKFFEETDEALRKLFDKPEHFVRVCVKLKGHAIWGRLDHRCIYLDGQAFGIPGTDRHHRGRRTALQFPTGAGTKASDFESWFYIRE
jgi:Family of unknown function (DUF6519)